MNKRMRMKRRQAERKKIHKILDLALEKNAEKPTVFFNFSGHVNWLEIQIHADGWRSGQLADKEYTVRVGDGCRLDSEDTVIAALEAL